MMDPRDTRALPAGIAAGVTGHTHYSTAGFSRGLVSILLPTKNEEHGLAATFETIPIEDLTSMGFDVEVVVVDGRSKDRTLEVAADRGARIIVQEGKGKGMAIRTARRFLRGDYILMLDSDDTYPTESIPEFVEMLERGEDVVMGSRLTGHIMEGAMTRTNLLGNRLLSGLASLLYGRRCTDVCTGMWGFRREALLGIELTSREFEIEAEMFARFVKGGYRLVEVPILYRPRTGDTKLGKFRDGFLIALELVKQRFIPHRANPEQPSGPRDLERDAFLEEGPAASGGPTSIGS